MSGLFINTKSFEYKTFYESKNFVEVFIDGRVFEDEIEIFFKLGKFFWQLKGGCDGK